jgi:Leucine Rich repeat
MVEKFLLASIVVLTALSARATDIVARAENTELRVSGNKVEPRVEYDVEGNITSLRLNDMQMTQDEFDQLGRLKHLRRLVLFRTNVTDRDVAQLEQCQSLEHLNMTSTEITDAAIESVLKLKKLESLCLGNVRVTPAGIEKLKELNRSRDRTDDDWLRWGYSQRKSDPK